MKRSLKDKAEGKFHEVKGKVKEQVGKLAVDSKLEAEGKVEHLAGKVQKVVGKIEDVLGA